MLTIAGGILIAFAALFVLAIAISILAGLITLSYDCFQSWRFDQWWKKHPSRIKIDQSSHVKQDSSRA